MSRPSRVLWQELRLVLNHGKIEPPGWLGETVLQMVQKSRKAAQDANNHKLFTAILQREKYLVKSGAKAHVLMFVQYGINAAGICDESPGTISDKHREERPYAMSTNPWWREPRTYFNLNPIIPGRLRGYEASTDLWRLSTCRCITTNTVSLSTSNPRRKTRSIPGTKRTTLETVTT